MNISPHASFLTKAEEFVKQALPPLMIVVHPGSLCGSYHTSPAFDQDNLNRLVAEIEGWKGDKVLIENELSDELTQWKYAEIAKCISNASGSYKAEGDRDELKKAVKAIARKYKFRNRHTFLITGAWADPDHGCVTTVAAAVQKMKGSGLDYYEFDYRWDEKILPVNVDISNHSPIFGYEEFSNYKEFFDFRRNILKQYEEWYFGYCADEQTFDGIKPLLNETTLGFWVFDDKQLVDIWSSDLSLKSTIDYQKCGPLSIAHTIAGLGLLPEIADKITSDHLMLDSDGNTVAHFAAESPGQLTAIKHLLTRQMLMRANKHRWNVAHWAARCGTIGEIADILTAEILSAVSNDGESVIDLAIKHSPEYVKTWMHTFPADLQAEILGKMLVS